MKREFFVLLMLSLFVVSSSYVLGDTLQGYVAQSTTISTACIRNNLLQSDANATITIFMQNGSVLVSQTNMTSSGNGTFSFTYVFNTTGSYTTDESCNFGDVSADGSTSIIISKQPFGNVQVIPQGINQVDLNNTVRVEWLVLLPNATNASDSSIVTSGGVCAVSDVNGVSMGVSPTVVVTNDAVNAAFRADPADGFAEGENYQVLCNISLTQGLQVNGVKSFIYVNPHKSFMQWLLQILGLAQSTNDAVNAELDIANQTLQIVRSLNTTGGGSLRAWTTQ